MTLEETFAQAIIQSKTITQRPSNEQLLQLYALYKQATEDYEKAKKPGVFDLVGQAKYEAWGKIKEMDKTQAMQSYVDLVNSLLA